VGARPVNGTPDAHPDLAANLIDGTVIEREI
jgi:hypothetical protein